MIHMKHNFQIVPATTALLLSLAPNLRQEDKNEIAAASGKQPYVALLTGLEQSDECLVAVDNLGPFLAFGCVPAESIGGIWLLCSPRIRQHRREFLHAAPRWFNHFHERFDVLTNLVDARNSLHLKMLKRLGCVFYEPVIHGPLGLPFVPFTHTAIPIV